MRHLYGLLGDPVAHSRSPRIHALAFSLLGVDAVYVPFRVRAPSLGAAFDGLRVLGASGFNVTVPYKREAFVRMDRHALSATRSGSVNCVLREGDSLVGHDTDGVGLLRSLAAVGIQAGGQRAVVLGSGGSGAACAAALVFAGAQVALLNRSGEMARRVAEALAVQGGAVKACALFEAGGALSRQAQEDLAAATLVVHCTTVGMGTEDVLVPPALLARGAALVDLVYAGAPGSKPGETGLLLAARARSELTVVDGLDVLVHQAIASLEIWLERAAGSLGGLFPGLRSAAEEDP